ncbi:MAG: helix-turn-helix domain-containing protein [Bradymonadaceae bacterium]
MSDGEDDSVDLEKVREADRLAEEAAEGGARPVPDDTLETVMGEKQTYTVEEVAELTGYSPETIRRHLRSGKLQGAKPSGGHYRISRVELEKWWREVLDGGELFGSGAADGPAHETS